VVKKQYLIAGGGLLLVLALFLFGRTDTIKPPVTAPAASKAKSLDINALIAEEKTHLSPVQAAALDKIENSITRGDLITQQIQVNNQLAGFWKDSGHSFEPYIFYLSNAAKLDKSEKNLTFAARLTLENIRGEQDEAKLNWKTELAIGLFEQALQLNPANDDLKVGLGSTYVFGKGKFGGPQETMKGIQQLLEVVRRDSNNMKAQLVLGVGGFVSGQYDKAIDRLKKVVKAEPENLEAIAFLADAYAAHGDKAEAIKWYNISKRMAKDPHYTQEVDERIKSLR